VTEHAHRVAVPLRGLRSLSWADDALPSLSKTFVDLGPGRGGRTGVAADAVPQRPVRDLLESRCNRFTDLERPRVCKRFGDHPLPRLGLVLAATASAR